MHADREMRSIFPASRAHEVRERRERSEHEAALLQRYSPFYGCLFLMVKPLGERVCVTPLANALRLPRAP